ncbi:ParB/RepB/Spo0J family partition protein [Eggerthella timonensis]|uniref:ParB/RepB/Spo0J family partition protein n=1 Tax=Eggerthella timonensis TaxID=1871008 RepID=UPI000C77FC3F|nr:ParB/RepB/Spo0J family partition protein [Eggerthella timonensis]
MPRGKELPLNLTPFDDLFKSQAERDDQAKEKIEEIPLSLIDDFPEHPFIVRDDEDMMRLVESVREVGVLTPVRLRRKDDGRYELVSGHRRKHAAELAGLDTLPCVVKDMTRDEAIIEMVDANLQRERILPSEKAYSYKMKLDAMKRQGQRSDLTSSPPGMKSQRRQSLEIIGEAGGDSRNTVHRYIRLTELIPKILALVDEGSIGMRPAVEISYLPKSEQVALADAIQSEACTPSHAQAIKMRRFSEQGKLTPEVVQSIMCEEKPNQAEQFRMPSEQLSKFFKPSMTKEEKAARIVKALELLEKQERKRSLER